MLKGCQRRIIKINGCGNTVFEEAYFILKNTNSDNTMSERELVFEANKIIESCSTKRNQKNSHTIKLNIGIFALLLIIDIAAFVMAAQILFGLI